MTDKYGFPTDPRHFWNKPAREQAREWKKIIDRRLAEFEVIWREARLHEVVVEAIEFCAVERVPPPRWAVLALRDIVPATKAVGRGRKSREQNMVHYDRWLAVTEAHERFNLSWEKCYSAAHEILKGTEAQGTRRAVKESYLKVQKDCREGNAKIYYIGSGRKLSR